MCRATISTLASLSATAAFAVLATANSLVPNRPQWVRSGSAAVSAADLQRQQHQPSDLAFSSHPTPATFLNAQIEVRAVLRRVIAQSRTRGVEDFLRPAFRIEGER